MVLRAAVPLAALSAILSGSVPPSPPATTDGTRCAGGDTVASCGRCHVAIHDEWSGSRHAQAWTSPTYTRALRDLERPERCHGCHAPEPVLPRLGRPPAARAESRHEGVTCRSCHATRRDGIGGPFGAPTDAHASEEHPAFGESGSLHLCGSCHDLRIGPVLPLARDFRAAGLADRGKSCIGCHMPRVRRPIARDPDTGAPSGATRAGRSHALRGPSDPEFCAEAFKIVVRRDGDRLELAVGNRAGHRVPGLVTRRFVFEVAQQDGGGRELRRDEVTLSAENPIWAAETRRFRFRLAPSAAAAEVVVHHRFGGDPVEIARDRHDL